MTIRRDLTAIAKAIGYAVLAAAVILFVAAVGAEFLT